uniref:Acetyltransf_18 domain-containing protein n=1 Tax=Syphacia muris TaxID=451379 RepID=A0A0N5AD56_9BILA
MPSPRYRKRKLVGRLGTAGDNELIRTVTVIDSSGTNKPVAFGAFQVCSKNQAYFIVHECQSKYTNKNVTVEEVPLEGKNDLHCCLKITAVADPEINYAYLPQYYGAFGERSHQPVLAHIYDVLVKMSFKTHYNIEASKNITIDLYSIEGFVVYSLGNERLSELRDRLGFVVTNNFALFEVTANRAALQHNLENVSDVEDAEEINVDNITYENLNATNEELLFDYDSTTSLFNRDKYINFLLQTKEVKCVLALESGQPVGYAMALNHRILQCYADSEFIARNLVCKVLSEMSTNTVKMFVFDDETSLSSEIIKTAEHLNKLQRYHSRLIPTQVKWDYVFLLNVGLNLY